jgi:hypothetical protein
MRHGGLPLWPFRPHSVGAHMEAIMLELIPDTFRSAPVFVNFKGFLSTRSSAVPMLVNQFVVPPSARETQTR